MAREGRVDEGIAALGRLTADSDDLRVRYDLIVVLGWAGRHPDAVAWWDKIGSPPAMPDYVLQAVVGSLLRVGDTARARTLSEHWQRQSPDQAQPLLAAAAVAERLGERLDALRYLGEAGLVGADAQRVRAEQARLLGQIGGHHGAFMLSPEPSWAQRADRTALQLRMALELAAPTTAQRQARLDAVLLELDGLVASLEAVGAEHRRVLRQVLGDRAVARAARRLWAAALTDVQAVKRMDDALPAHVLKAEGAALLGLKRPREARAAYEAALALQAQDAQAQWGLFYALSDLRQWEAAMAWADTLVAQRWRQASGQARPQDNADWIEASILAARVRSWAEDPAAAWTRLQALLQTAPDDASLRLALGEVAAARGWPRLAEDELRIGQMLDDEDADVKLSLLESALRRNRWAELRSGLAHFSQTHSDHPALPRLQRDVALQQGHELTLETRQRWEPAGAGQSPGSSRTVSLRVQGALGDSLWRPFALAEQSSVRAQGQFSAQRRRTGAGLLRQGPDSSIEAALWQQEGSLGGTGASIDLSRAFNDHWSASAGWSRLSTDAPLRAAASGIHADGRNLALSHAWSEQASTSLRWQGLNFSDGNRRDSWQWSALLHLLTTPAWRLSLQPQVDANRNTQTDVPYFSPRRDGTVQLALVSERSFAHSGERQWNERIVLTAGRYEQAGYGARKIADASYELTQVLGPRLELGGSITWLRRAYDGVMQDAQRTQLRLISRF